MPPNPNSSERVVLEHPDTTAIKEHEIAPLKARVDKCYSKEDYKSFQKDVEEIVIKTIDVGEGREKIKKHSTEATKDFFENETWKQKVFWIPTAVAIIAILVAWFKNS